MAAVAMLGIPVSWLTILFADFEIRKDDATWLKENIRTLLIKQILHAQPSQPLPKTVAESDQKITLSISIPEPAGGIAMRQAKENNLSVGQHLKQLLRLAAANPAAHALLQEVIPDEAKPLIDTIEKMAAGGQKLTVRIEQARHFVQLDNALSRGRIGMCEAGTGTGKTLAMLRAAAKIAIENNSRVVITVPTLLLLNQFANKYAQVRAVEPNLPNLRVVMGRKEFVSASSLAQYLDSESAEDNQPIRQWVAANAPAPKGSAIAIRWLASSLQAIAPDFPLDDVTLPDLIDKSDPGYLSYKATFLADREIQAQILVCSHAMVAYDMRLSMQLAYTDEDYKSLSAQLYAAYKASKLLEGDDKKAHMAAIEALKVRIAEKFDDATQEGCLIPAYQYLIIDEAHLFEQNVSMATSEYLSLLSLLRQMKKINAAGGKISKKLLNQAQEIIQDVAGLMKTEESISLLTQQDLSIIIRERLTTLSLIIDEPKLAKGASLELQALHLIYRRMVLTLKSAFNQRANWQVSLHQSPVRKYPQLSIGRSSVENILKKLWDSVAGGAAVSATLYLKKNDGYSASFMSTLLAIPAARLAEYSPVTPSWVASTLSGIFITAPVQTPTGYWLRPPTRRDRLSVEAKLEAENVWLAELGHEIKQIHASAAGGTLVLMTSYQTAAKLGALFEVMGEQCITAVPSLSLTTQRSRFLTVSKAGHKPLWITVGAGWTGLDVGGHDPWSDAFGQELPADQDNVLTDLVIARLPFGTNRTITHAYRVLNKPNIPWDILDTAYKFRQGIGRLVRREGLPRNRRLFVLDGRMNDLDFAGTLKVIKNILSQYQCTPYAGKTSLK